MKIAVACDHGGFRLKNVLVEYLKDNGYEVEDFGCYSEESCDYPDYAGKAALAVAKGTCDKGIVVCGTGIGVSITANKVKVFVVHYAMMYLALKQHEHIMIQICLRWDKE